jgi:hypothetical protein
MAVVEGGKPVLFSSLARPRSNGWRPQLVGGRIAGCRHRFVRTACANGEPPMSCAGGESAHNSWPCRLLALDSTYRCPMHMDAGRGSDDVCRFVVHRFAVHADPTRTTSQHAQRTRETREVLIADGGVVDLSDRRAAIMAITDVGAVNRLAASTLRPGTVWTNS